MSFRSRVHPPSYAAQNLERAPSYSVEPNAMEHRIARSDRAAPRPSGSFVKLSRGSEARLVLIAQPDDTEYPIYGTFSNVAGTVDIQRPDTITNVELKLEGKLKLREIAEGGSETVQLCSVTTVLWSSSAWTANGRQCPSSLPFSIPLPATFDYDGETFPLPPSYTTKLPGMPGFFASIDYRVNLTLSRQNSSIPLMKAPLFGTGPMSITTPFLYRPRTRPSKPIPILPTVTPRGFLPSSDWRCFESTIRTKDRSQADINTRLYVPSTRIFHVDQSIPFLVQYESTSYSLAGFLPFGPTSQGMPSRRATKIQAMRQTIVDVHQKADVPGTKTDIWRVDTIGEGTFMHAGDGPKWIAFRGQVKLNKDIQVTGFKAAGLSVKDFILLTMNPLEPQKCPFRELRVVVPIRLTTDSWTTDRAGLGFPLTSGTESSSEFSVPSSPSEELFVTPSLHYNGPVGIAL